MGTYQDTEVCSLYQTGCTPSPNTDKANYTMYTIEHCRDLKVFSVDAYFNASTSQTQLEFTYLDPNRTTHVIKVDDVMNNTWVPIVISRTMSHTNYEYHFQISVDNVILTTAIWNYQDITRLITI